LNPITETGRKKIVKKDIGSAVVKQLALYPLFKGSNPATAGMGREII
jgi:hypothetical protein